jgi:rhomboid protease GluP
MTPLIALLVLGVVAWRAATKEQRIAILQVIDAAFLKVVETGRKELERLRAERRIRASRFIATPVITVLSLAVFLLTLGGGRDSHLLFWGADFGPRTSNGEWWRLVTAIFVNRRVVLLFVNIVALGQIGLALEGIIGSLSVAATFVVAGVFAGLLGLSKYPTAVIAGPSGAIFGLYGLLIIVSVGLWRRRSDLLMSTFSARWLAAVAAAFTLLNVFNRETGGTASLVGLLVGMLFGIATARDAEHSAPVRRVAVATAAGLLIAVACAIPLRGILDVRPEIQRLVSVEEHTAGTYKAADDRYKKGRLSAEALAELIERTIIPELQAADARLDALHGVPAEDATLLADGHDYLRQRSESWRLRVDGLRLAGKSAKGVVKSEGDSDVGFRTRAQTQYRAMLVALGKAEGAERDSLQTLDRLQRPLVPSP